MGGHFAATKAKNRAKGKFDLNKGQMITPTITMTARELTVEEGRGERERKMKSEGSYRSVCVV